MIGEADYIAQANEAEEDVSWMVNAMFEWLSDDRIRMLVQRRGQATAMGIKVWGGLLDSHKRGGIKLRASLVRKELIAMLTDRVVRVSISRMVALQEFAEYDEDPNLWLMERREEVPGDLTRIRRELLEIREGVEREIRLERLKP